MNTVEGSDDDDAALTDYGPGGWDVKDLAQSNHNQFFDVKADTMTLTKVRVPVSGQCTPDSVCR